MIGFDDGTEQHRLLDTRPVMTINPDLTSSSDLTSAKILSENLGLSFQGTAQVGPFEISEELAKRFISVTGNPNNRPNSDVIKRSINGLDIVRNPRNIWTIDFGAEMSLADASEYEQPFEYIRKHVKPFRDNVRRKNHREKWWLFGEARPGMRRALSGLSRYIATPWVSKYRIFVWVPIETIPSLVAVIARDDDYSLGVLQSKIHLVWALKQGSSLEDRPRYTPTTTFETFPFPWAPGKEPKDNTRVQAIAKAAKELVEQRDRWLNKEKPP